MKPTDGTTIFANFRKGGKFWIDHWGKLRKKYEKQNKSTTSNWFRPQCNASLTHAWQDLAWDWQTRIVSTILYYRTECFSQFNIHSIHNPNITRVSFVFFAFDITEICKVFHIQFDAKVWHDANMCVQLWKDQRKTISWCGKYYIHI